MNEIAFQVQRDEDSGLLLAYWDAPDASGGISTQGKDLRDLQDQVIEAVAVHFDAGEVPNRVCLHGRHCQVSSAARLHDDAPEWIPCPVSKGRQARHRPHAQIRSSRNASKRSSSG